MDLIIASIFFGFFTCPNLNENTEKKLRIHDRYTYYIHYRHDVSLGMREYSSGSNSG